jgi:redox-sensitive bicupin YhaK (pirin superfamily)
MNPSAILKIKKLGFPWATQDPFLFCVHHLDYYPKGNDQLGPASSLAGRNIGNDFVIKDGWRMYHGDTIPGFPAHPHRGFETVTFVLQGLVDHADSNSAAGRYGNGDVQWMTAGSGLQHSEMFPLLNKDKENPFELFQIWLNLPAASKFVTPTYKMLWEESIPKIKIKDANQKNIEIQLAAGKYGNFSAPAPAPDSWAASPENEVNIWHIKLEENAIWEIPTARGKVNRSLYFVEGENIDAESNNIQINHVLELDASREISIKNGNKPSRLLLLQGKPIGEQVEQYGPFVMNNMAEIEQAFSDYRKTRFGGWPWPRTDMVHGKEAVRFARFDNGDEIIKD